MKEKIISINIINPHKTICTLESGQLIEQWHMENDYPKIGDSVNVDNLISPFTEITKNGLYDQRKKSHRSPLY